MNIEFNAKTEIGNDDDNETQDHSLSVFVFEIGLNSFVCISYGNMVRIWLNVNEFAQSGKALTPKVIIIGDDNVTILSQYLVTSFHVLVEINTLLET